MEKVSDLEPLVDNIKFGVDNAWLTRECAVMKGLLKNMVPVCPANPMSLGLVYQAAANGKMDVVLAYTTDGRIKAFDLKVLEDDRRFFPPCYFTCGK